MSTIELTCTELSDNERAIKAIRHCLNAMPGFFTRATLFHAGAIDTPPDGIRCVRTSFCESSIRQLYSVWRLREQVRWIESDFYLNIHWDGWITRPDLWNNEWFDYDYIGAPWATGVVGNGAFCLRSKRLMEWVSRHPAPLTWNNSEDKYISLLLADDIRNAGFKIAPLEVAERFSVEDQVTGREERHPAWTFGFHWHIWLPHVKHWLGEHYPL